MTLRAAELPDDVARWVAHGFGLFRWRSRAELDTVLVEFSEAFDRLTPEGKRYIVAHEQAHLEAGPDHDAAFYDALHRLVKKREIDWRTAWELERYNRPRASKAGHALGCCPP